MPVADSSRIQLEVHLENLDPALERAELRRQLTLRPRRIPTRYFYDDAGSRLFEEITRQPEYYLTRAEATLLADAAPEVAWRAAAGTLVELGSGTATKTRFLLDAMAAAGRLERYVPFDVDEEVVRRSAVELVAAYPGLEVHGVVGDFTHHLERVPAADRRLIAFLGSTIGNFDDRQSARFLGEMAASMTAGDSFLLGADQTRDAAVLEAAYNDAAGVTARFNRNVLAVVNRRFGGDFDPEGFAHRAVYDREHHRIEMRLVACRGGRVRLEALDLELDLEPGERIVTEISTKYDRPTLERLLGGAGLRPVDWWSDPDRRFLLVLSELA